ADHSEPQENLSVCAGRHSLRTSSTAMTHLHYPGLQEDAHVLRQEHILVEDDRAAGDLPRAIDMPQHILPCTDVEGLFGFGPGSVHHEVGVDLAFCRGVP